MIITTDNQNYTDIASAIREKNGTDVTYKPSEMALAIANIDAGGIKCTLTITTGVGASVVATLDDKTVSAIADENGVVVLELDKEGTWNITATLDGEAKSIEVNTSLSMTKNVSFFPENYMLLAIYTENSTWTAPEDGYYQIELQGASGGGGHDGFGDYALGGGGGGGGGCAISRVKLNAGDTVSFTLGTGGDPEEEIESGDSIATISSSIESYPSLNVTGAANGGKPKSTSNVAGAGGSGGVASGGNYANYTGGKGSAGEKDPDSASGGAGGAAGYGLGNAGGRGQASDQTYYNYGKDAFIMIYQGYKELTIDPIFANNSWGVISEVSKQGRAQEFWSIGDEKSATVDDKSTTVRIVDFDHFTVANSAYYGRTYAGIALEIKDVMTPTQTADNADANADTLISTKAEFKDYAVSFNFKKGKTNNNGSTNTAKGALPAEIEIFGNTDSGYDYNEGTQLAYYAAGNSKVKYTVGTTTAAGYWMRTLASNGMGTLCVNSSGAAAVGMATKCGIAPIFCI